MQRTKRCKGRRDAKDEEIGNFESDANDEEMGKLESDACDDEREEKISNGIAKVYIFHVQGQL